MRGIFICPFPVTESSLTRLLLPFLHSPMDGLLRKLSGLFLCNIRVPAGHLRLYMKEPASDSSAQTIASCRNSDEAGAIVMELSVPGKGLIKYVDLRTVSCSEKDTEFL